MNLIKFNPFLPVNEHFGNLDTFLNRSISDFVGSDFLNVLPNANVVDSEQAVEIELAVPGLSRSDFEVKIENNVLVVSAEATDEKNQEAKFTRREFSYRSFSRRFPLNDNINQKGIVAEYKEGILKITLPKYTKNKKEVLKTIEIS